VSTENTLAIQKKKDEPGEGEDIRGEKVGAIQVRRHKAEKVLEQLRMEK